MGYIENYNTLEITPMILEMKPRIESLFNWLNGYVNHRINCKLNICGYSVNNFAIFQYPNQVSVYLGSIIDFSTQMSHGLDVFNCSMSLAALTITHELFHSDQALDNRRYTDDDEYKDSIERAAEYNAEQFCAAHIIDFKMLFGFDYKMKHKTPYENFVKGSISDYYVYGVPGVLCSTLIRDRMTDMFYRYENFGIYITDNRMEEVPPFNYDTGCILRWHGRAVNSPEDIAHFQALLGKYMNGTNMYDMTMSLSHAILEKNNEHIDLLYICINNMNYYPFAFD